MKKPLEIDCDDKECKVSKVPDNWAIFPSGKMYCKKHQHEFQNECEECKKTLSPSLPMESDKPEKEVLDFEQGNEQGVTSLTRSIKKIPDCHSHAFRFVVKLPDIENWNARDIILKDKGFKAERKAGIGRVIMSDCFGFKCWFADKSITIYFPSWKRYFVDEARIGYNYAVADLFELLRKLQDIFSCSFAFKGQVCFRVAGQHHGLMHNSLAKMYNRNNEKLHVYDKNGELWLLVDNSDPEGFGLNECEGVHAVKAPSDVDDRVAPFFNQLRETGLLPENILGMFKKVADIQKVQAESSNNISALIDKRFNDFQENIIKPWMEQISVHLPVEQKAAQALTEDVEVRKETLKALKAIQSQRYHPQRLKNVSFVGAGHQGRAASSLTISKYDSERERKRKLARSYLDDFGWGSSLWGDD